jgi:hypothetical protein
LEKNKWKSVFHIPLENIPGTASGGERKEIRGNLHATFGRPKNHFSLNPNLENRPDFHRPDLFKALMEL